MNSSANTKSSTNKNTSPFDIHEKLKINIKNGGESYSYLKDIPSHQNDVNFEFITITIPEITFLIYRKLGNYFVLVDFFNNYEDACDEAKEIINEKDLKQTIFGWLEYQKNKHI